MGIFFETLEFGILAAILVMGGFTSVSTRKRNKVHFKGEKL